MLKKLSLIILIAVISFSCSGDNSFNLKLVKPPVATRQLGPSIFFSKNFIKENGIKEGTPIRIFANGYQMDLRPYMFFGKDNEFAVHKEIADAFNFKSGFNSIKIKKIKLSETSLTPKPIAFKVENYHGNLSKWKGYAYGAPHGDCDNETGAVVKKMTRLSGIPSTAAYGCRVSYRGIWYDCNRPLMKEPKKGNRGVIPVREWNKAAEAKYKVFQDSVLANSKMKYGKRFKLYCSFHGHDLTVKYPDGRKIERPVIEGMGMGFSNAELRRIKAFYYRKRKNYYKNPPDLYFGNLPEDKVYYYDGVKLHFFYTGLGARTYGALRRDFLRNGLHFETPNTMRIPLKAQDETARLLTDLYSFVRDSIFTSRKNEKPFTGRVSRPKDINARVKIPAGKFVMGTNSEEVWSCEKPAHEVYLDSYFIDKYEVSNYKFTKFLNDYLSKDKISVKKGKVILNRNSKILYDAGNPYAEISFKRNKFKVKKNREYFPVILATYWGASEYAKYSGGRLPTEAEWEKAASWDYRKNKKSFYSVRSDKMKKSFANYDRTDDPFEFNMPGTTPIGYYKTSSYYGVKDMSGNVWEWTADDYVYGIYKKPGNTPVKNPLVKDSTATMKSIRGGAWDTEYAVLRSTMRLGINHDNGLVNLGFRCVYDKK